MNWLTDSPICLLPPTPPGFMEHLWWTRHWDHEVDKTHRMTGSETEPRAISVNRPVDLRKAVSLLSTICQEIYPKYLCWKQLRTTNGNYVMDIPGIFSDYMEQNRTAPRAYVIFLIPRAQVSGWRSLFCDTLSSKLSKTSHPSLAGQSPYVLYRKWVKLHFVMRTRVSTPSPSHQNCFFCPFLSGRLYNALPPENW